MRGYCLAACVATALGMAGSLAGPVQAAPISDNYIGGVAPGYGDVVGSTSDFNIFSIDVTRINTTAKTADLQVVVKTNYIPGTLSTGFGSLFFGTDLSKVNIDLTNSTKNDTFALDPDRFNYVFGIPTNPALKSGKANGTGSLYALNGTGTDVQLSYWPSTSNTTDPPPTNFRTGQAVGYTGKGPALRTGTWDFSASADTLTFIITNENYLFGSDFYIAWAMTCANDVILALANAFVPPPGGGGQVPLPAGFLLMGTVLLGAGGVARWRKRRMAQAA